MKLALIFLLSALVVNSQQQFQHKGRPRGLFWLSPYSPQDVDKNDQQSASISTAKKFGFAISNGDHLPELEKLSPSSRYIIYRNKRNHFQFYLEENLRIFRMKISTQMSISVTKIVTIASSRLMKSTTLREESSSIN